MMPGDGIGKEVIPAALQVLQEVIPDLETVPAEAGWACFEKHGVSVPQETLDAITACGAALFGAVSSPSRKVKGYRSAILTMRQALDLYANLRPVRSLPHISPAQGIDFLVVRENTEGMYAQREHRDGDTAIAERVITRAASLRIGQVAVDLAAQRDRKLLTIVHKANILPVTDGLFRDCVREAAADYPMVVVDELLVDIACLKVVSEPKRYDVIVTTNLFGDIISDVASYWAGGMGYAPSINIGRDAVLAEPVHGSAPDIAGQGIANPIAAILSAALLVRYAWQNEEGAVRIEEAVRAFLKTSGQDVLAGKLGTSAITDGVLKQL
ncbi:MAG: isocitrate/isopropylmalate dehydrogenase family protein [Anaerolineaceae bacterium]|nr:isocitrate/isopropylmalate dehydrogenase family protein [Anaerolineaceae bacterium]